MPTPANLTALSQADFAAYNTDTSNTNLTVADFWDGDAFSQDQLNEFVFRFLKTSDPTTLDYFRAKMDRHLLFNIRDSMITILEDTKNGDEFWMENLGLTDVDLQRYKILLRNDFVLSGVSTSVSLTTSYYSSRDHYATTDSTGAPLFHETATEQVFQNTLGSNWAYTHALTRMAITERLGLAVGEEFQNKAYSSESEYDGEVYDSRAFADAQTPLFLSVAPGFGIADPNDTVWFDIDGWYKRYFDPMPDGVQSNSGATLSLYWYLLQNSKFSIENLNFSFENTEYAPPRYAEDSQQSYLRPKGGILLSYQFAPRFALLAGYDLDVTKAVYSLFNSDETRHNYRLLSQWIINNHHSFKIGPAGETLESDSQDKGDKSTLHTQEQEWGGLLSYEGYFFDNTLKLIPEIKIGDNFSDGSLVGSYVDGTFTLLGQLNLGAVVWDFSGSVYHKDWHMDYRQLPGDSSSTAEGPKSGTTTKVGASTALTFTPSDRTNIKVKYGFGTTQETGFTQKASPSHSASLSLRQLLFRVPIKIYADLYGSAYFYEGDYALDNLSRWDGNYYYASFALSTNDFQVARTNTRDP